MKRINTRVGIAYVNAKFFPTFIRKGTQICINTMRLECFSAPRREYDVSFSGHLRVITVVIRNMYD